MMQLSNITIAGQAGLKDICIDNGTITAVETAGILVPGTRIPLVFNNAIAFPGLVNSHDHLDFNCFPRLGNKIYESYTEWGTDIHRVNKATIDAVLAVPRHLRTRWGMYKNLLNGITTVVHHGAALPVAQDLITVQQDADSFHSVSGEKGWRFKLLRPSRSNKTVAIHIGEGVSAAAFKEINTLIAWNLLRRPLVGIHGVVMNARQAAAFLALVWCPGSNDFLLNTTARIHLLKQNTSILFGTDSTLSASWSIWEQLRLARSQHMAGDAELFDMLTTTPAAIWHLKHNGSIAANQCADIVVAKPPDHTNGWDAFYALNPEDIVLVLHKGRIQLFDHELYDQLQGAGEPMEDFYPISLEGNRKYVRGNLPALAADIQQYYPDVQFPFTTSH